MWLNEILQRVKQSIYDNKCKKEIICLWFNWYICEPVSSKPFVAQLFQPCVLRKGYWCGSILGLLSLAPCGKSWISWPFDKGTEVSKIIKFLEVSWQVLRRGWWRAQINALLGSPTWQVLVYLLSDPCRKTGAQSSAWGSANKIWVPGVGIELDPNRRVMESME